MLIASIFWKITLGAGLVLGGITLNISKSYLELRNYLQWAEVEFPNTHPTIAVIRANDVCTRDLGDYFLGSRTLSPLYIENKGSSHRGADLVKSRSIVTFLVSIEEFVKVLEESYKIRFWHSHAKVHFVICTPVPNYYWIQTSMKLIWKYLYYNFVLVYTYKEHLEVLGYNPFNNTILNYTKDYKSVNIFQSKLKNIYGYEVRVSMHGDVRNTWKNGSFSGQDGELLTKFIKKMNATIKYMIPNASVDSIALQMGNDDVVARRSDFFFVTRVLRNNGNFKYSYPHEMDDVVVLTPKAEKVPQYLNLLLTFHYRLWMVIGIFLVTEAVVTFIIQKLTADKSTFATTQFNVYLMLLNLPFPGLFKKSYPVKLLLVFWSYYAMIICASFQTSLTSTLVVPKYFSELNTVQEIQAEGLKICIPAFHASIIPHTDPIFKDFDTSLSKEGMIDMMLKGDTSCAYALPKSYMTAIIERNFARGKHFYHVASEHIIPSLAVYYFPSKSPYIGECNRVIEAEKEFGFMEKRSNLRRSHPKHQTRKRDKNVLSLNHLQTGFYVLFVGYLLGGVVLLFEILWNKFKNHHSDQHTIFSRVSK